MTELVFYLTGVGVGVSRGVTEAIKFIYKNRELPPYYIDTHSEYHTFTLFMWLMILLMCINSLIAGLKNVSLYNIPLYFIVTFLGYYLPYRMSYNYTRGRGAFGDFYYKFYMFDFRGKTIKIEYISVRQAIVLNMLALVYSVVRIFI